MGFSPVLWAQSLKLSNLAREHCPVCKIAETETRFFNKKVPGTAVQQYIPFHDMHVLLEKKAYDSLMPAILHTEEFYGKKVRNDTLLYLTYYIKGSFYLKKKLYQKALNEILRAKGIFKEPSSPPGNLNLLSDIALLYYERQDYTSALRHYLEIVPQLDSMQNNKDLKGIVYNNMARCYANMEKHDFEKSERYYKKSISIYTEIKDTMRLAVGYLNLGDLYFEQYKDNLAMYYFNKSLSLAESINDIDISGAAYFNLSLVSEAKGNPEKALSFYKDYMQVQQNMWDRDKLWKLADQEKKFALNKKETEITLLKNKAKLDSALLKVKRVQSTTFFIVALCSFLLLLVSLYAYRQKVKNSKIIKAKNKELHTLNHTRDRLFSIVAHDLKSPVLSLRESNRRLQSAFLEKDRKKLKKLIHINISITDKTYAMIDNLLFWVLEQNKKLMFRKEPHFLCSTVEQVCFNFREHIEDKRIHFTRNIPENIQVHADINALKLIIRNLLDNAIKFTPREGVIKLYAYIQDGDVWFVVEDNGIGISQEILENIFDSNSKTVGKDTNGKTGTGLGLELSRMMAEKNEGRLILESTKGTGTRAYVSLKHI